MLRLLTEPLASGEVVGSAEHIGSGRTATLRSLAEFEAFARAALERETAEAREG